LFVSLGNAPPAVWEDATTLASDVPFTPFSLVFVPLTSTNSARIVFDHAGGDNLGLLLDNVVLADSIPEPETWALMLAGMGLVGFIARRRRGASSSVSRGG